MTRRLCDGVRGELRLSLRSDTPMRSRGLKPFLPTSRFRETATGFELLNFRITTQLTMSFTRSASAAAMVNRTGRTTSCRLVKPPCQWIATPTYSLSRRCERRPCPPNVGRFPCDPGGLCRRRARAPGGRRRVPQSEPALSARVAAVAHEGTDRSRHRGGFSMRTSPSSTASPGPTTNSRTTPRVKIR